MGEDKLALAKDGGLVESGVHHGTGGAVGEWSGVQKEADHLLPTFGGVLLIVYETVRLLLVASVGAGRGNGPAKLFNQGESEVVGGVADAESAFGGL